MENTIGIASAARILGVSVKTLQRWECEGRLLPAARTTTKEMVQDLMTIVRRFSSRLYGLRNYRRQLLAALENKHVAGTPDTN
jgi:predicted site-specific integrase-resolvase